MNYTQVKNPKWANAEHTAIECDVNFDDLQQEFVSFTAVASGDYPHTHEIFFRCVAGEFGAIAEYEALPIPQYVSPSKEELLAELSALAAKISALE